MDIEYNLYKTVTPHPNANIMACETNRKALECKDTEKGKMCGRKRFAKN